MEWWPTKIENLDRLIDTEGGRGIAVPKRAGGYATLLLISGPPGCGKSTAALQMSVGWAEAGKRVLFLSFERNHGNLKEWLGTAGLTHLKKWINFRESPRTSGGLVLFEGRESLRGFHHFPAASDTDAKAEVSNFETNLETLRKIWKGAHRWIREGEESAAAELRFDAVVIDGFNSEFKTTAAARRLNLLREVFLETTDLVTVIYDSPSTEKVSSGYTVWQYAADAALEFLIQRVRGYELKKLRILKARNQRHAFGEHLVKLWPREREIADRRAGEGKSRIRSGITIFPSEHFFVTQCQGNRNAEPRSEDLEDRPRITLSHGRKGDRDEKGRLEGLVRAGKVTVLTGPPGSLKRNIAHRFLLDGLLQNKEPNTNLTVVPVLLSLREPERTIRQQIEETWGECEIELDASELWTKKLTGYFRRPSHAKDYEIESFLPSGVLPVDVRYFEPGAIAPEEFLAVIRGIFDPWLENRGIRFRVLIQDLAQLDPRFPLCAASPVFMTALTEYFRTQAITTLMLLPRFPDDEQSMAYSALKMADQVLTLRRIVVKREHKVQETNRSIMLDDQVVVVDPEWNPEHASSQRLIELYKEGKQPLEVKEDLVSWNEISQVQLLS